MAVRGTAHESHTSSIKGGSCSRLPEKGVRAVGQSRAVFLLPTWRILLCKLLLEACMGYVMEGVSSLQKRAQGWSKSCKSRRTTLKLPCLIPVSCSCSRGTERKKYPWFEVQTSCWIWDPDPYYFKPQKGLWVVVNNWKHLVTLLLFYSI